MKSTEKAGEHAAKGGVAIVLISIAMGLMVGVIKLLGFVSPSDLVKATAAVVAIMGIFAVIIKMSQFAGADAHKAGILIMEMAAAMFLLTLPIAVLSYLKPSGIATAVAAISWLMIVFSLVLYATTLMPESKVEKAKGVILAMGTVLGVLAVALGALSLIKPEKLQSAVSAMVSVMAAFALMIAALQFIDTAGAVKSIAIIVIMSLAVAGMGYLVYTLTSMNPEKAMQVAGSLALLLTAMSVAMMVAGNIGPDIARGLVAITAMTIVVGILGAIMGILGALNVLPSLESAAALSLLLVTMSVVTGILAAIGPVATLAIAGLEAMLIVFGVLGTVMIALGTAVKVFDKMGVDAIGTIKTGIKVLSLIAEGVGSFVSSIMEGFTSNLPDIGEDLSLFADGLIPFIEGMKKVDKSVLTGVKTLADAVSTLSGVNNGSAFTKAIGGSNGLEKFGEALPVFGDKLAEFAGKISGINAPMFSILTEAVTNIVDAANNIPKEGLFGGTSIDEFGPQLATFGTSLVTFSETVGQIDNLDQFEKATKAGKELVKMANAIPEGGLFKTDLSTFATHITQFGNGLVNFNNKVKQIENFQQFKTVSDAAKHIVTMSKKIPEGGLFVNDLGTFSTHIQQFGSGLLSFSNSIAEIKNVEKFATVAEAAQYVVDMSEDIPEGGLFVNDLGSFASHIGMFGGGLLSFSKSIAGINNVKKFATISEASGHIVDICKNLPEGGLFDGKMDLKDLGKQIEDFGVGLSSFSSSVANTDAESVNAAISTAKDMLAIVQGAAGIESDSTSGFKEAMTNLGDLGVGSFVNAINQSSESVSNATRSLANIAITSFKNAIATTGGMNSSATMLVLKFTNAINTKKSTISSAFKSMGEAGLNAFKTKYSSYKTAGETLILRLIAGIRAKDKSMIDACKSNAEKAVEGVREKYYRFEAAGKYLGEGLVEGIKAKKQAAYNAGLALGKASAQGVEDGAEEQSPSKRAIRAGKYLGEGLVIGINAMNDAAYSAGETMGSDASEGLARALDPIKNLANLDIDTQPTIRPVLDLTDVQNGARSIGSMLDNQRVSLNSSINSVVDRASNICNGYSDNEVVNAINKLRTDISGMSKTENNVNFNGATFNDDSRIGQLALNLFYEIARKEAMG